MSFAKWKKKTDLLVYVDTWNRKEAIRACQAAYKAGERQGRKDAEDAAKRAIMLSGLVRLCGSDNPAPLDIKIPAHYD